MPENTNIHIAFFLPSLNIGGVETVFINYANVLEDRGYNIDIVVAKKEGALVNTLANKINLVHFNGIPLRKSGASLRKYIKTNKPDILITGPDVPNFLGVIYTKIIPSKTKLIISQHGYIDHDTKDLGVTGKLIPLLKRILYPLADKILAVSNGIANDLKKMKLPQSKIVTLKNAIDLQVIHLKSQEKCDIKLPKEYILFLGRLSNVKNIPLLIKSFDLINNEQIELVIVGSGAEEQELKTLAATMKNKGRIQFLGGLTNPFPIIAHAKIVAIPSLSEAFPMVAIESIALGKTIVYTPNKGCKEVLGEHNGYCANTFSDPHIFANSLNLALETPLEKENLEKHVSQYRITTTILQLENIIHNILNK